ncbi:hypothetical protein GCM10010149_45860 [Nonomuraea roseoviolacea subsp. roseoviolacea]|uniref:Streptogramin lyase n=1 Tax=Nonomuraea roseoviolacea subsp. carminata TaxID=160689 RepID=A0ABT1KFP2_9ACTN|nr:hypothetical protein [Nonomuraea roseoviolacea]MCP2352467.1 streptogramin lyase [Nonomuraea roseoviolacea subsp. carminata]
MLKHLLVAAAVVAGAFTVSGAFVAAAVSAHPAQQTGSATVHVPAKATPTDYYNEDDEDRAR